MPITPGDSIGPYLVERELGRGGMGVVFLGRDTRLDRPVAIKALPEHLAEDPERLARFEREAKTLAQLSHPNVAGIYGVEVSEGARYLVLEYVEGETLADRLDHGPLPIDDAIEIAAQIAAGVEAAHDAGVIHRDLKPGNVIVTPDGRAKVLDFGLARADESRSSSSVSYVQTLTSPAMHSPTVPGVIMGTAAYMSPEQARGRKVDKRTDIWSLGVILYEMLCGASPFLGETVSDSIGAILHKDLDLSRVPASAPPGVHRALARSLHRDRDGRYRDIGDMRLDLLAREPFVPAAPAPAPVRRSMAPVLVVAALVAAIAGGAAWLLKPAPPAPVLHVAVPISTVKPDNQFWSRDTFDVHPSGMQIAYIGVDPADTSESPTPAIYVRDLDAPTARMLEGTQYARRLAYSPDGTQIAYMWISPDAPQPELRRVGAAGGASVKLFTDPPRFRMSFPPRWIDDSRLAVLGDDFTTLYIGSASGGLPEEFINLAEASPGYLFTFGMWSPPSGDLLYISGMKAPSGADVYELNLETKELRTLIPDAGGFRLINGHTAFFRHRGVWSVAAWDASAREIVGEIIPVMAEFSRGDVVFAMTPAGTVVYESRTTAEVSRVMSIDRSGRVEPVSDARREFGGHVSVSPDGEQLALHIVEEGGRAFALDIASGYLRPASPDKGRFGAPTWLPDGRYAYTDFTDSVADMDVFVADLNAVGAGEPLLTEIGWDYELSHDGALAFTTKATPGNSDVDILLIDMATGDRKALLATNDGEWDPTPSPDGRLLAYITSGMGGARVAIRTFDAASRTLSTRPVPVSSSGAKGLFWSADGEELFWWNTETNALMAANVRHQPADDGQAPTLEISKERIVFTADQMPVHIDWHPQPVDISPDGERFYFIEARRIEEAPAYLNVITNWGDELERLARPR